MNNEVTTIPNKKKRKFDLKDTQLWIFAGRLEQEFTLMHILEVSVNTIYLTFLISDATFISLQT